MTILIENLLVDFVVVVVAQIHYKNRSSFES